MTAPVRLAKRVSELVPCSRREAEQYIEGGWVRVDGRVVETPQFRVLAQKIELDPKATLDPVAPVTLLLHKPGGYAWEGERKPALQLLVKGNRWALDRSGIRPLRRHFLEQLCVTPLEPAATGLLVFTQDWSIRRKLLEDAALVESEVMVEVRGPVGADALQRLNRTQTVDGRQLPPAKVSIGSQTDAVTGLRFAIKDHAPGRVADLCEQAGLGILGMKRIRIGRVPLAGLPSGQWRYLPALERF